MNKGKIKLMIQEKLNMIETLRSHVQVLNDLLGEEANISNDHISNSNDISRKIDSYRQKLMREIEGSLPGMSGDSVGIPMGGMPGQFSDIRNQFDQMKSKAGKKIQE